MQFSPGTATDLDDDGLRRVRPAVHRAGGGRQRAWTGAWTSGGCSAQSSYAPEVIGLYHARPASTSIAGTSTVLTHARANIAADPRAIRSLEQTSVPTGRLQVPELDMHTISDQLVPVQQENYYRHTVQQQVPRASARPGVRAAPAALQLHSRRARRRGPRGTAAHRIASLDLAFGTRPARGQRDQPGSRRCRVHPVRARAALRRQRAVWLGHRPDLGCANHARRNAQTDSGTEISRRPTSQASVPRAGPSASPCPREDGLEGGTCFGRSAVGGQRAQSQVTLVRPRPSGPLRQPLRE